MKAGYVITSTDYYGLSTTEIQVANYHNINLIRLYYLVHKSTKEDDNYENIIGRWNIKYKNYERNSIDGFIKT